jgi:hypothetical protein
VVLSALKSHPFEPAEEVDDNYEFSEDIRARLELDIALLNLNHEEGLESLSVLNLDQEFGVWRFVCF